jgi:dihydrodipicolinate synthase/N-acetylneuraminate lyase
MAFRRGSHSVYDTQYHLVWAPKYRKKILAAAKAGDMEAAKAAQARMTDMMFAMYGGPTIACWLAGLKYALVRVGVFSTALNILDYEVTDEQRVVIDRALEEHAEEI